ncbi:outer membrane protein assembly factor BamB family protein [Streptomyces sp. NPDC055632]
MDLKDGRELWHAPIPAADDKSRFEPDPVAAGGGLAVLADKGLRAVDVRTGAPRWTAAVPQHCLPGRAAPAERHVTVLLACGDPGKPWSDGAPANAEPYAAAFDPTTGAPLWSTPFGRRHHPPERHTRPVRHQPLNETRHERLIEPLSPRVVAGQPVLRGRITAVCRRGGR